MNEKIKLPAQEWLGYDPERGDMHGYTFEQMEKFAEQIILECIRKYQELDDAVVVYSLGEGKEVTKEQLILRHFGIK